MRSLSASIIVASLSLLPNLSSAVPAPESTLLAQYQQQYQQQPGWWEQEGRQDELRERYWRLSPPERYRYNQLEAQIRDLWVRQQQLRQEQRRILRWGF